MEKLMATIQNQLDSLNPRERKLVIGMGLFIGVVFTWLVLIEPAINQLNGADARRAALLDKANKVMLAADNLEAMRGTRSQVTVQAEELNSRLSKLAADNGLRNQLALSEANNGEIEVTLSEAPAAGVLRWMAQVDSLGNVSIEAAELTKNAAGVISGKLQVKQAGGR